MESEPEPANPAGNSTSPTEAQLGPQPSAVETTVYGNRQPRNERECTICQESIADNELTRAACNHVFHTACIYPWRNSDRSNRHLCPNCRQDMHLPATPPVSPSATMTSLFDGLDVHSDPMETIANDVIQPPVLTTTSTSTTSSRGTLTSNTSQSASGTQAQTQGQQAPPSGNVANLPGNQTHGQQTRRSSRRSSTANTPLILRQVMDDGLTRRCQAVTARNTQCTFKVKAPHSDTLCTRHIGVEVTRSIRTEKKQKKMDAKMAEFVARSRELASEELEDLAEDIGEVTDYATQVERIVSESTNSARAAHEGVRSYLARFQQRP